MHHGKSSFLSFKQRPGLRREADWFTASCVAKTIRRPGEEEHKTSLEMNLLNTLQNNWVWGVCVIVMEDGLESGLFCQESGVGWARAVVDRSRYIGAGGEARAQARFQTLPEVTADWAVWCASLCERTRACWVGGVGWGLHCHTVHTVYAYQATVSASLSHKCLLEFILGEFHMTGTGISINYGIERFV